MLLRWRAPNPRISVTNEEHNHMELPGFGDRSIPTVNVLRRALMNEQPILIFLQETKLKQSEMETIRRNYDSQIC